MHAKTIATIEILAILPLIPAFYVIFNTQFNEAILLLDPYFDEDALISRLAVIASASTLIIAPIVYFWKIIHDERNERKRASKNIHIELEDALDGLDYYKHKIDFKDVRLKSGITVKFMNRALNHDFYDSLVFSGKINFLPPEIQQSVQDTFQRIKDHNLYIRKIRDMEDNAKKDEDISWKTERYYEMLDETEIILLDEIPKIKEKLKKEFNIN